MGIGLQGFWGLSFWIALYRFVCSATLGPQSGPSVTHKPMRVHPNRCPPKPRKLRPYTPQVGRSPGWHFCWNASYVNGLRPLANGIVLGPQKQTTHHKTKHCVCGQGMCGECAARFKTNIMKFMYVFVVCVVLLGQS
jgi:hypothetical protein